LRREYGVNPAKLNNRAWINLYAEYRYTEKERYDLLVAANRQALAEIINQLFPHEQ
jgi:predicted DNA-binding protein (MmcQ/YjbR family)